MLPHGYTNHTVAHGAELVQKSYIGADAAVRRATEHACLISLADHLPVPLVIPGGGECVTLMRRLPGRHGQEVADDGHGRDVLYAAGVLLQRLQSLPYSLVKPPLSGDGDVLVHGDFGVQNMLFDDRCQVTGVLDWELAHRGDAIEDIAWAEWIVRMHHAEHVDALAGLFAGFGGCPPWDERLAFMIDRCQQLRLRCLAEGVHEGAELWASRSRTTAGWRERN